MDAVTQIFWERGIRYTRAYGVTPLCCPGRASILTGRYAHNHRVRSNRARNLDHSTTIQRFLQQEGYRTGVSGKFLNGWGLRREPPFFDRWAILKGSYFSGTYNMDGQVKFVPGYTTKVVTDHAQEILEDFEDSDNTPWFLFVGVSAPHSGYQAPRRYEETSFRRWNPSPAVRERDRTDKPGWVRRQDGTPAIGRRIRTEQLQTLLAVDDEVSRLFDTLDALEEDRNTLAFFTSDNGYMWADHGLAGGGYGKRAPYTNSVRVPLLVRWPQRFPGGLTSSDLVANIDIAPTILQAAGIPASTATMDGDSLLGERDRKRLLFEYWRDPKTNVRTWASLRQRRYQYIEYYERGEKTVFREYYDLRRDPWQLRNVLHDRREGNEPRRSRLRLLHNRLQNARSCAADACP